MTSNGVAFRALKQFKLKQDTLSLAVGQEYDLGTHVQASDSAGVPIAESKDGQGRFLTYRPNIDWTADSQRGTVTSTATLKALGEGLLTLTAAATPTPAPTVMPTQAVVQNPDKVRTFAGSGNFSDGTSTAAGFLSPAGLALDPSGNLYVADSRGNRIRRITPEGVVTTLAGNGEAGAEDGTGAGARFNYPAGVSFDSSTDELVVSDFNNWAVRRVTLTGQVSTLARFFQHATGIAVDSSGTTYLADSGTHEIRKISPLGEVSTLAGGTQGYVDAKGALAGFDRPTQLAMGPGGNLLVADLNNNRIRKVAPDGTVTTLSATASKP